MCVLTYIPTATGHCIMTHNRDEHMTRPMALPPESRVVGDTSAVFPVDPVGGGTWFAAHQDWVCALLNGGFRPHVRQLPYTRSRGTIITDFLKVRDWVTFTEYFDGHGMEPFTFIAFGIETMALYQMVWDGQVAHLRQLDHSQPHIWSSSTLYDDREKQNRKNIFFDLLQLAPNAEEVFKFHERHQQNDPANSFFVRRDDSIHTVAIIQCAITQEQYHIKYKTFYAQTSNTHHELSSIH
jgi:Transport and Golgi organisation 2